MAITIVAKFRGRCRCGARVLPGARVGYQRRAIVDCVACRPAEDFESAANWERAVLQDGTDIVERPASAESAAVVE